MKDLLCAKQCVVSLFFLFSGILSLVLENIFYGYIDQNGVLQESLFLPLGTLSFLLGVVGLSASITWFFFKKFKKARR